MTRDRGGSRGGLSVRDVEYTFADALGAEVALSKWTVSRVRNAIGEGFERATRRLDELGLDHLFLDASIFRSAPAHLPNRCWPRGASPPAARRCSWRGPLAGRSPRVRGVTPR